MYSPEGLAFACPLTGIYHNRGVSPLVICCLSGPGPDLYLYPLLWWICTLPCRSFVCLPLFRVIFGLLPELSTFRTALSDNYVFWARMVSADQTAR